MSNYQILAGDCRATLATLPAASVHTCITSPPYYGLRDYGEAGQIGLEQTPAEYIAKLVAVFGEVWRVLRPDGTLWLNLGDSYAGYWGDQTARDEGRRSSADTNGWTNGFNMNARPQFDNLKRSGLKPKDMIGIPWRVAFALQAAGWYLRSDIIWHKPNPMPESVADRPTKAHEYLFLLSKAERYYYDAEAIKENGAAPIRQAGPNALRGQGHFRTGKGPANRADRDMETIGRTGYRNRRSVWTVATQPYPEAHFATFPPALIEPCILAGCPVGGVVLDPFAGSGTTLAVALKHGRRAIGCELNPAYIELIHTRCAEMSIEPVQIAGSAEDWAKCPLFADQG